MLLLYFSLSCLLTVRPQSEYTRASLLLFMIDKQLFEMRVIDEIISPSSPVTVKLPGEGTRGLQGTCVGRQFGSYSPLGISEIGLRLLVGARGYIEPFVMTRFCMTINLNRENNLIDIVCI